MQTLPGDEAVAELDEAAPGADESIDLDALSDDGPPRGIGAWSERTRSRFERGIEIVLVAGAVIFVLLQVGPHNLFANNTPTGGDMGAHVWGPAYLRDHLLPHGRITGWTPDWYDGFPAFQFYMVVPALLVVALNTGLHGWAALLPLALAIYLAVDVRLARVGIFTWRGAKHSWQRRVLVTAAILIALFGIGLPYGVAFKLVTVSGIVTIPISAYAFGRLSGLPFPAPPILSLASLLFVFNLEPVQSGTGNIIGGNATSTLAGEYSFSIALSLGILFLGLLVHGLRTGRHRPLAAVVFALAILCHLIVGFFLILAALLALIVWPGWARLRWLAPVGVIGGMLASFWLVPFVGRQAYVNDMGWEKSPPNIGKFSFWEILRNHSPDPTNIDALNKVRDQILHDYLVPSGLYVVITLAVVGLAVSAVLKIRVGLWLSLMTFVLAILFVVAPEDRLWNARILPFYYLCLCLLAAIGVAEVARALALLLARNPSRPVIGVTWAAPIVAGFAVLLLVGLPLGVIPNQKEEARDDGKTYYSIGPFGFTATRNPARDFARWNFTGYEGKAAYPEYYGLMDTMAKVGQDEGCGRAMWEYDGTRLGSYGTPMAPMLLPHWTDGCIGSMEGLYFESSATTPFHFINQGELSTACSCSQRNLPYSGFDLDRGLAHLQLLGVRYYVAETANAVAQAKGNPLLTEVATSGPWHVYKVADSDLVEPLTNEPAVVTDHATGLSWVYGDGNPHTSEIKANGPAMQWYLDPTKWDVYLASSGPSSWSRVATGDAPPVRPEAATAVSGIKTSDDSIEFDVATPGVPVLVKSSYFPNWQASGAEGPYRVAPNLMVVIPTSTHVRLHYGWTTLDIGAYLLSALGIGLLVLLARRPDVKMPPLDEDADALLNRYLDGDDDEDVLVDDIPRPDRPAPPGLVRLSVVIPAYREADRIAATIAQVRAELADLGGGVEIVVVDDGSTDGTAAAAHEGGADIVLVHEVNRGKGAAVRTGMLAANGRTIAFTDADLSYSPDQLAGFAEAIEAGADVAVGSRFHEATHTLVRTGRLRELGGRAVNFLTQLVLLEDHRDTQCGIKAFRSDVAREMFGRAHIDGFAFDVEVFVMAERNHLDLVEVPVTIANTSRSTVHVVRDAARLVRDLFKIHRSANRGDYDLPIEAEVSGVAADR